MIVQDCLRKSGGGRRKIDCRIILIGELYTWGEAGTVGSQLVIVLRKGWAVPSHIEKKPVLADRVRDFLHPAGEFRSKYKYICLSKLQTVLDLIRGVTKIQRHCQGSCLQYPEINGQPLQAVHQKNRHLIALADPPAHQELSKTICLFIKDMPGNLPAVVAHGTGLDQFIVPPCNPPPLLNIWIYLNQADIIRILSGISFQ